MVARPLSVFAEPAAVPGALAGAGAAVVGRACAARCRSCWPPSRWCTRCRRAASGSSTSSSSWSSSTPWSRARRCRGWPGGCGSATTDGGRRPGHRVGAAGAAARPPAVGVDPRGVPDARRRGRRAAAAGRRRGHAGGPGRQELRAAAARRCCGAATNCWSWPPTRCATRPSSGCGRSAGAASWPAGWAPADGPGAGPRQDAGSGGRRSVAGVRPDRTGADATDPRRNVRHLSTDPKELRAKPWCNPRAARAAPV